MFADQWLDFGTVPDALPPTTAVASGVMRGTDNGRGSNTKHSAALISNGSKIVVPQGFGLITITNTLSGSRGRNFIRQSAAGGIQSAGLTRRIGAAPKGQKMLDEKLITQEDYDMLKTRLLNL